MPLWMTNVAFKQALRINDYTNMKKNLMQGDFSMETVWQESSLNCAMLQR